MGPCCGALIKDGCFLVDAPASFLLLQLSYFLRKQIIIMRGENIYFYLLNFALPLCGRPAVAPTVVSRL